MTELYSLHKDKIRVLLLEGVNDSAVELIRSAGYTNLTQLKTALNETALGAEVARKLIDYSDVGTTVGAVNFPQVQLPARPTGTRYIHVHRNVPGMLGHLNQVFSRRDLNIIAQYLQTDGEIGYVVIEAEGSHEQSRETLDEIRVLERTIRARLLYAWG